MPLVAVLQIAMHYCTVLLIWRTSSVARKLGAEYPGAIFHPPSSDFGATSPPSLELRRGRQANSQGFAESDTRPVWRGLARNIGQELFAANGKPAGELMACRNLPSAM